MTSKVLITGAAGFIGSSLFKRIKSRYDVLGIDDFNNYYDPKLKVDRTKFHELDVRNLNITRKEDLESVFSSFLPDIVVHLAAMPGPRHSIKEPTVYHRVNIEGTQNIIDACDRYRVKRVIYASTSSVCSGIKTLPWREDMPIGYPSSPYGYTKYVNECQFRMSSVRNIGLRFFSVYGPWGRPDMALFDFTKKIMNGETIEIFNYGNMKRDFTYIDDIIDGIELVLENDNIETNEIFNIGNGKQVDLLDFVHEIERSLSKKSNMIKSPMPKGDTLETLADISKLGSLGYSPKTSVKEGIPKFVEWFRTYYQK